MSGREKPTKPRNRGFRPVALLRTAIRNSPWLVIAIVVHVIAFAGLSIMYVATHNAKKEERQSAVAISAPKEEEPEVEVKQEEVIERDSVPKPVNTDAVLEEATDIDLTLDAARDTSLTTNADTASGDAAATDSSVGDTGNANTGIGVGTGGRRSAERPSTGLRQERKQRIGGAEIQKTEKAVLAGLRWLARHQSPDGSWSATKCGTLCKPDNTCCPTGATVSDEFDEGLTGLATLAFLGAGYDHSARQRIKDPVRDKEFRVGEVVKDALQWLKQRQAGFKDGRFTENGHIYNESLATLAMCEAYSMSLHEAWKDSAQRGIDFLVKAQRRNPSGKGMWGWRYQPREFAESEAAKAGYDKPAEWERAKTESDTSVTTWVVMALKSAKEAGLNVPDETMAGAMEFLRSVTTKDGRVAYKDIREVGQKIRGEGDEYDYHEASIAALGMCIRTFIEKDITDPMLEKSAERVVKDLPNAKSKLAVDYYYWYYATLALNQFDGPDSPKATGRYWKPWNKAMVEALLPLQEQPEKDKDGKEVSACTNGSWPTPDRWSLTGGPIYRTAINVMTLEVYYRFENAFGSGVAMRKKKGAEKSEHRPDLESKPEAKPK
jgi:hypothetical protein